MYKEKDFVLVKMEVMSVNPKDNDELILELPDGMGRELHINQSEVISVPELKTKHDTIAIINEMKKEYYEPYMEDVPRFDIASFLEDLIKKYDIHIGPRREGLSESEIQLLNHKK